MTSKNIRFFTVVQSCYKSFFYFLLFTFHFLICFAQKAPGKLAGKITDAGNNQTLNGANIVAKSISKGTRSIVDGTYILSLPAGVYTISFSYTGYQPKDIKEVEIKTGETNYLDIALENARQLEAVVVTSSVKREAQSAIYNKQKISAAASDGISIEAIRKTPDVNAGQIMKRVTGVNVQDNRYVVVRGLGDQYNQTMLNGVLMTSTESNRNAFALDLIPAAVLDNITVNKTATPDMPGNFAGGIVQINTKEFPANDFYSITLGTGFSDQTLGKNFYSDKRDKWEILGFGAGIRELPDEFPNPAKKTGSISSFNDIEKQRYLRMLKNNLAPINHGPSGVNESIQLGYGKTIKFKSENQIGIVAAISQRKAELIEQEIIEKDPFVGKGGSSSNKEIFGLNYYSENQRYKYSADFGGVVNLAYRFGNNKITLKNLYTQIYNNTFINRPFAKVNSDIFPGTGNNSGITYLVEQKSIINSILSGEHRTGKDNDTRIEWNLNTTINNTNTPDVRNFFLEIDSFGILRSNGNISSAEQALQQNSRIWTKDHDFIYGGAFNITTPFTLYKNKQLFKAGILFQNRIRKTNAVVITYQGLADQLDSLLAPSHFYLPPPLGAGLSNFANISGSTGTYNAGSSLLAAYWSFEHKIRDKLRIIWGVRAENYQQYVNVYDPVFFSNFQNFDLNIQSVTGRTTFNFLPSVNMVYALNKKINIRLAYSKTVVRPELKDLANFPRYDYQTFTLSQGNAGLRSTSIQNYDFKFEVFPSAGEIISFAAFYKQLKDAIEYVRNPTINHEIYVAPVNAGKAFVRGLEAEIRKKIDFISFAPWLKNVTLFGNGTLLKSKVAAQLLNDIITPSIAEHTLTGQPAYIINTGVSISAFNNSFEVTASYNKTGDYISQLGSADKLFILSNGDRVLLTPNSRINPRNMIDVTLSQALFKNKCKLKISVANLLNSRYIVYQDVNGNGKFDEPISVNLRSPDITSAYKNGIDNTISNITSQRTFSFYISYTF
jgi:Outer membrane protein beta-barrel family/CarboxypepD_reg-like domain/TonB-dependent Receptor Plug Domain